jgi:hypothetical protein
LVNICSLFWHVFFNCIIIVFFFAPFGHDHLAGHDSHHSLSLFFYCSSWSCFVGLLNMVWDERKSIEFLLG